jgi:hypothetical protein
MYDRRRNRRRFAACLPAIALAMAGACRSSHPQISDPSFDAVVAAPAFRGNGPKVLFDDGHRNFHRSDGRYAPFVTLVRNDGCVVTSNTKPFDLAALKPFDILVIVNAEGETTGAPAFTAAEIEAVGAWVDGGGSLLLVADHSPFGRASNAMAERFGVSMLDAHLKDENHHDPSLPGPFFLLFSRENGLLGEHPITHGINRVVTFGGQALRVHSPAELLLRLSPDARIVRDLKQPAVTEPAGPDAAHAVALVRGKGRVVIIGEAAALTAQIITGDAAKPFGVKELRFGMSRDGIDNKQFALNIVRWLARGTRE